MALSTGFSYIQLKVLRMTNCGLNKTATIQLFNILQKTEQYKHVEFAFLVLFFLMLML